MLIFEHILLLRFDMQNNTETSENNDGIDPGIINLWNEIWIICKELGELYQTPSLNHLQTIEPAFSRNDSSMNPTKAPSPVSNQSKHFLSLHNKNGCAKKVSAILLGLVMFAVGLVILKLLGEINIGYGVITGGLILFLGGLAFLSQQKILESRSPRLSF